VRKPNISFTVAAQALTFLLNNSELQLDNNELLHEIQGTVDGLETLLAAQYQPDPRPLPYALPSVPSHLKSRFVDALSINQPASFQRLADFPLKEGWDALIIHFFEEVQ
jgi:hypothetical protein